MNKKSDILFNMNFASYPLLMIQVEKLGNDLEFLEKSENEKLSILTRLAEEAVNERKMLNNSAVVNYDPSTQGKSLFDRTIKAVKPVTSAVKRVFIEKSSRVDRLECLRQLPKHLLDEGIRKLINCIGNESKIEGSHISVKMALVNILDAVPSALTTEENIQSIVEACRSDNTMKSKRALWVLDHITDKLANESASSNLFGIIAAELLFLNNTSKLNDTQTKFYTSILVKCFGNLQLTLALYLNPGKNQTNDYTSHILKKGVPFLKSSLENTDLVEQIMGDPYAKKCLDRLKEKKFI